MRTSILAIFIILGGFVSTLCQSAVLVKDINPGPYASASYDYGSLQVKDALYFIGDIGSFRDLYVIKNGEVTLIKRICEESCFSVKALLFSYENKVFFKVHTSDSIDQLWQTDGTIAGTSMVVEYNGRFDNYVIGNNSKIYLGTYNRKTYKYEVQILDPITVQMKKIASDLKLGDNSDRFGIPIAYANGIASANIINDSLKLYKIEDENIELLAALKTKKGSTINGLKSIHGNDIVLLIHSDDLSVSDLYLYSATTKKINKDRALPFTRQEYPFLKDYSRDSLILFYHTGGFFLLSGNPLSLANITPYSDEYKSQYENYYNYKNKISAYLNFDNTSIKRIKLVIFDGDPNAKKVYSLNDSNTPKLLGYNKYAVYSENDPVYKSGSFTLYDLELNSQKKIFSYNQTFSSNIVSPIGFIGSKLYFFGNLNEAYGRELYYIETGIPTSTEGDVMVLNPDFKFIWSGHNYRVRSQNDISDSFKLSFFDSTGRLLTQTIADKNLEYEFSNSVKGLVFVKVIDQKSNKSHTWSIFIKD